MLRFSVSFSVTYSTKLCYISSTNKPPPKMCSEALWSAYKAPTTVAARIHDGGKLSLSVRFSCPRRSFEGDHTEDPNKRLTATESVTTQERNFLLFNFPFYSLFQFKFPISSTNATIQKLIMICNNI